MSQKQVIQKPELDLTTLHISSLAHLCRQATDRYFQQEAYDDSYCLELFRRAIQEKDEAAWVVVLDQYSSLVRSWVQRHYSFPAADEEPDFFVNRAFDNLWSAFSRNPDKLQKFRNLKSLLQYLKLCTHTAVQSYVERKMPPRSITQSEQPLDTVAERVDSINSVDDNIVAGIVWKYVVESLKTEQERVIAREFLLHDIKPQEIFARHKDLFADVSQVRRVKGNLMTRLRRNTQLMAIVAGVD